MIEISEDAWEVAGDVLAITTNSTIRFGKNIMGGGIAGEAARRFSWLPGYHGSLIKHGGPHVYLVATGSCLLLMFPTKGRVEDDSTLERIAESVVETKALADVYGWQRIVLPRPGAGLGGLDWLRDVRPILADSLDERFVVVSYPDRP